jgi:hypothetical protein
MLQLTTRVNERSNGEEGLNNGIRISTIVTLDEIRCSSARRVRKPRLAFQQT